MLAAAVVLTALFLNIPLAYEILKWLGALFLLFPTWLAVQRYVMGGVLAGMAAKLAAEPRHGV
ncbi:hypothetical protein [Billgrantia diversa]|uniref:hypothetical protein n=1 Tax=Halomonas sp. MCCC 1A13316 TaxID=2733487 RepID=UPI0018D3BDBB|nr:hypothetical protein [Halomonas sp. MCCC 1A13316]